MPNFNTSFSNSYSGASAMTSNEQTDTRALGPTAIDFMQYMLRRESLEKPPKLIDQASYIEGLLSKLAWQGPGFEDWRLLYCGGYVSGQRPELTVAIIFRPSRNLVAKRSLISWSCLTKLSVLMR